ncbi:ABC transporter ATP-binding/permease protein [Planctomycetes bacterium Poly30]|uniref:ABC transporter ATP-binding/permease protein n=1 Tax=Saltatorellus ferox TaxID=2528018 RepID=A0A518EXV8_9BACT|nr:ABC transporter ATP-binding/permease protein [Planctomycetes bacterium Poly30]
MARLFVLSGSLIGSTYDFFETSTVGRGDGADIVIAEASISRSHARLVPRPVPGQWKVVDLKSSNGVFVGGKRVSSGIVGDGDTFRLGEIELRLRDETAGDSAGEQEADFEDFFEEDGEDHDGEEIFPGVVESDEHGAPAEDDGFELEFGDDLDDAIASQAEAARKSSSPPPARTLPPTRDDAKGQAGAGQAGSREGARATAQRAQRRQEALKGSSAAARASMAGTANPSGGSRPVLQYSAAKHAASGDDLAQMSSGKRALILLLGVALMAGIAYGAFTLTRTARDQAATLSEELPE